MKSKFFALLLSAFMALSLMAGCGDEKKEAAAPAAPAAVESASAEQPAAEPAAQPEAQPAAEPAAQPAAQPQKINILMEVVPDTDFVLEQIAAFEKETGIEVVVEAINYASMHEKLLTQLLSRTNSYDVIVVDFYWVKEFADAKWMEPLDSYIKDSAFDTNVYVPTMMEMVGAVDGVTYMLPFYNYMLGLVYRTDIFEDEELKSEYEERFGREFILPDNMDDYVEMCKFITEKKGETLAGVVMQGLRPDPITMEWLNYFFSSGADFFDANGDVTVNSPEAVHSLELYVDNMNNAAPAGAPGFGFDEAFNVFAQGNAASYTTYNWMLQKLDNPEESTVPGKVAFSWMPGGISLNAGWGWAIPHNAPNKEAAWKFLNWVESFDVAKARAMAGGCPTRADIFADPDLLAKYPHYEVVLEVMAKSKMFPQLVEANQLIEILGRELSEAVSGSKTSQAALDTVAEEMRKMK
ncbi:MAG: extracellular solute-binding protein [Deltaproteobacteria bacterium]|jgi:ABC-type glycerol-3-phosphate transport system substrate-binding protein|nr:extracellular solute-binding protein [Deltaproteobacteria bacterium]